MDKIYGKGINYRPVIDGKQDTPHSKEIYLEKLLPLEEYDKIIVLFSGGKTVWRVCSTCWSWAFPGRKSNCGTTI